MSGRRWTPEEERVLIEKYPTHFASEICEELNRSISSVHNRAGLLGLKCAKEKIVRSGKMAANHPNVIANQFSKGHVSHNKGKKMSPEVYEKAKGTMFRKGNIPSNFRKIGSERVNVDGYIEVKVADPCKWRLKHRVVWEEAHGAIPKGYNIQFRNGNKQDVRIENLYIISRSEQLKNENCMMARYPEELRQVIMLKAAIKRKITINRKSKNEESKS